MNDDTPRTFTKNNLSGYRLPSTLNVLVLHLRRTLTFSTLLHLSKYKKYNIKKTFCMHKIPLYIKQFFSYDINSPSAFLLKLSFYTHISH